MFDFDEKLSTAITGSGTATAEQKEPVKGPLSPDLLSKMQRYWQAANYLTIGQIYLRENPLIARAPDT